VRAASNRAQSDNCAARPPKQSYQTFLAAAQPLHPARAAQPKNRSTPTTKPSELHSKPSSMNSGSSLDNPQSFCRPSPRSA
jgi:hypothetical protein